jgi:hypothetical protein
MEYAGRILRFSKYLKILNFHKPLYVGQHKATRDVYFTLCHQFRPFVYILSFWERAWPVKLLLGPDLLKKTQVSTCLSRNLYGRYP